MKPTDIPFWDELADQCVAFGSGMVVDSFAVTGSTALAAIRARRDWLACDYDPAYLESFKIRCDMTRRPGPYPATRKPVASSAGFWE